MLSVDILDYDTFLTDLATAAGLTYDGAAVTWQVLGSTETVAANSRLPASVSSPGLYRLDGVKVADNTSDLWDGTIDNPINVSETGTAGVAGRVATGSTSDGSIANDGWLGLHIAAIITTATRAQRAGLRRESASPVLDPVVI